MPKRSRPGRHERKLFKRRQEDWVPFHGRGYRLDEKRELQLFLKKLNKNGKLGQVILDVGSGAHVAIDYSRTIYSPNHVGPFFPIKGKKVIRADIAFPRSFHQKGEVAEVQGDIQYPHPTTLEKKMKFARIMKFLGENPRDPNPKIDTILFSDILNYVDYHQTIRRLSKYLKKGGRIVIMNGPHVGLMELLSRKGIESNARLITYLQRSGFIIEHFTSLKYAVQNPGTIGQFLKNDFKSVDLKKVVFDKDTIILVARKK